MTRITGSPPAAANLPHLFEGDMTDGWGRGMRAITHALLATTTLPPGPVLEVGCGGGQFLAELRARLAGRTVYGVDLHPLALAHAQRRVAGAPLAQATLDALPCPADCFALVVALDVFDQQGVDLAAALAAARRVLLPGGLLLLRVSAYPWLYGAHDIAFQTGRRYARRELAAALAGAGLTVERITHANAGLAAPVIVQRLAQRWGLLPWMPGLYGSGGLNDVAALVLQWEARRLRHGDLPLGLSLYALARKPLSTRERER